MRIGNGILRALIKKFPNAGNCTIARMAYLEHPKIWSTMEAARSTVRFIRGANGKDSKRYLADKSLVRPIGKPGDPFSKFPEGMTQIENWGPTKIEGKFNALILADAHIPYHDKDALVTAIDYGKKNGANVILLNGDAADCFSVSFWEKNPEQRNFGKEIQVMREFLQTLRGEFPKARIIYKLGNHEERFIRYMRVKAPELIGVDIFNFDEMLKLKDCDVEVVQDKRPLKLGDLNVIHGHEYRFAISNPVNPARGLFLRCKAYALCGHFHQSSYHTEKTVEQNVIATWSTGCLCDLHPEYMPMNNWCHGFAFVEVAQDGKFNLQNKVIRHGKIY